ncbi:iron-sulfur cluster co-chaperone protein HscB [Mustelus asterias]
MLRGLCLRATVTAARSGAGIPLAQRVGAGIPLAQRAGAGVPLTQRAGAGVPLTQRAGAGIASNQRAWARISPGGRPGLRSLCSAGGSCWRCGAPPPEPPGFFCASCRALQPPDRRCDYFQLLGLPRRFRVSAEELGRCQRRLQRELHPDRFSRSAEAERRFSEQQSALVNEAYGTLLRPLSRGFYLLRLELPAEAEPEEGGSLPPDAEPAFLATVLRLNERLEEADSPEEMGRVAAEVEARLRELSEEVARAFEQRRPRDARPLLRQMRFWSSLGERVKERQLPR